MTLMIWLCINRNNPTKTATSGASHNEFEFLKATYHLNKFWISRHKMEPILPHWNANVYWIPSNLSSIVVADSLTSFKKPDIQKSRFKQKIGFSTNELNLIIIAWVSLCYQKLDSLKFRIKPPEINTLHLCNKHNIA